MKPKRVKNRLDYDGELKILKRKKVELKDYKTSEIVKEIEKREAVQKIWVAAYEPFEIINNGYKVSTEVKEGACSILII